MDVTRTILTVAGAILLAIAAFYVIGIVTGAVFSLISSLIKLAIIAGAIYLGFWLLRMAYRRRATRP